MAKPNTPETRPIAEISNEPSAFERFLDRNQLLLIGLGILVAIAAAVGVVMNGIDDGKKVGAGQALVKANDIEALQTVMTDHPDSPAAASAAVLLSDKQWDEGLQEDAIETLRQEITANPDHPATFPARARLGARLAAQGNLVDAKAVFEELVASPKASYLAPFALSSLAQIAHAQGDAEAADDYIERVTEVYPTNPMTSVVQQSSKYLGFVMPEEVEAPPEEPTAEANSTSISPEAMVTTDPITQAASEAFPESPEPPVESPEPSVEAEATPVE